jgi:hypothetical protein
MLTGPLDPLAITGSAPGGLGAVIALLQRSRALEH